MKSLVSLQCHPHLPGVYLKQLGTLLGNCNDVSTLWLLLEWRSDVELYDASNMAKWNWKKFIHTSRKHRL